MEDINEEKGRQQEPPNAHNALLFNMPAQRQNFFPFLPPASPLFLTSKGDALPTFLPAGVCVFWPFVHHKLIRQVKGAIYAVGQKELKCHKPMHKCSPEF